MASNLDVTQNWSKQRVRMQEIALFRVLSGKIVEETFMFQPSSSRQDGDAS